MCVGFTLGVSAEVSPQHATKITWKQNALPKKQTCRDGCINPSVWTNSGWWLTTNNLPLWKMMEWKSVGIIIPNIWKSKKMFQTTNQNYTDHKYTYVYNIYIHMIIYYIMIVLNKDNSKNNDNNKIYIYRLLVLLLYDTNNCTIYISLYNFLYTCI